MNHGSALCAATRLGCSSTATRPSRHLKAGSKPWRTRAISAASSAGIDSIKRNVRKSGDIEYVGIVIPELSRHSGISRPRTLLPRASRATESRCSSTRSSTTPSLLNSRSLDVFIRYAPTLRDVHPAPQERVSPRGRAGGSSPPAWRSRWPAEERVLAPTHEQRRETENV